MKKLLLLSSLLIIMSGCSIKDDFNDEYIYTTIYPIEYGTSVLYSDYGTITSIYPNAASKDFKLTSKKKDIYSEGELFVYSGLLKEAPIARDLINRNEEMMIIDATKGMSIIYDNEEIWLDPSNYLMLCSNIKRTLIEYNDNPYVKEKIEKNYDELNEKISELDVALYNLGKNGNFNTILTTNDVFNYLTKYNINVISLDKDKESLDKEISSAKKLITEKEIQYIYMLEDEELTESQEAFITEQNILKVPINNMYTLTDEQRDSDEDYISLMNKIIEEYKRELYKTK